jgi:acyl-CoA oxidase
MQFILQYVTNRFITKKESEMQEIEALAAGMIFYLEHNGCFTGMSGNMAKGYLSENRIDALKMILKSTLLRVIIQY